MQKYTKTPTNQSFFNKKDYFLELKSPEKQTIFHKSKITSNKIK